jgi:hypothetical protein
MSMPTEKMDRDRRLLLTAPLLIDGNGSPPIRDAAVIVDEAGAIAWVGPRDCMPVDPPSTHLGVERGAILPGLIDAHIHTTLPADMVAYLKHGVTTVRYAGMNSEAVRRIRLDLQARDVPSPRILDCGPMIDMAPASWPEWSVTIRDEAEAQVTARQLLSAGDLDGLFVAQRATPEGVAAVVAIAHAAGKPVAGQLWATDAATAAAIGVDQLDNNSRIFASRVWPDERLLAYRTMPERLAMLAGGWATIDWKRSLPQLKAMVDAGVAYCPTFVVWENQAGLYGDELAATDDFNALYSPDEHAEWVRTSSRTRLGWRKSDAAAWRAALEPRMEWVGRFRDSGGGVIVGTDMQYGGLVLAREIRHLLTCGYDVVGAIRCATGESARVLGILEETGTVESGKLAELVMVESSPLEDIDALSRIAFVIQGTRAWTVPDLQEAAVKAGVCGSCR